MKAVTPEELKNMSPEEAYETGKKEALHVIKNNIVCVRATHDIDRQMLLHVDNVSSLFEDASRDNANGILSQILSGGLVHRADSKQEVESESGNYSVQRVVDTLYAVEPSFAKWLEKEKAK